MKHDLFVDGTVKEYSWSIKTENKIVNQIREHPPAYLSGGKLDVKDKQQSKCIAIHVGIYWGLGVFIIKDSDIVNVRVLQSPFHDSYAIISSYLFQNFLDGNLLVELYCVKRIGGDLLIYIKGDMFKEFIGKDFSELGKD